MWCMKCKHDLMECECPDLAERLAKVTRLAIMWCRACDKSYHQCRCVTPDHYVKHGQSAEPTPEATP